jgi:molecular chaperone GrpE
VTDKRRIHPDAAEATDEAPDQAVPGPTGGSPEGSGSRASPEGVVAQGAEGPRAAPEGDASEPGQASEVAEARAKAAEYLEHLQRLQAEFENYRKRVLKEQTRAVELAAEPLMAKLLEVLDEFELALMAAERKPDLDRFLHGVELVYAKLTDILRSEGLERIDAEGKPFDPEMHEALLQSEGDAEGEPYVADVLRSGYRLRGRVIRPAGVKVGRR